MDTRFFDYVQRERIAAIDEFIDELTTYICFKKKIYKKEQWTKIMTNIREEMFEERDRNRDKEEPIIAGSHCVKHGATGNVCNRRATNGPYCNRHKPKGEVKK